jgi:hypothetical protein
VTAESVSIPARFNGPLESGQGGYSAGIAAGLLGGAAEVTLRRPVPLDTELAVARDEEESLRVLDGKTLVVEARPVPDLDLEIPAPVTPGEAHRASAGYRGTDHGPFSHCFVCGLARDDAFGVFAGDVEGREVVASPWTPPAWSADRDGNVLPEFVWAVLDCPTFFAAYIGQELPMSVLGRLTARVDTPVRAGEEHVVMAWPLDVDGRKRTAGAAVLSADGQPLAVARALNIETRPNEMSAEPAPRIVSLRNGTTVFRNLLFFG